MQYMQTKITKNKKEEEKMKEQIAKRIKETAVKAAKRSVGKSTTFGVYEVKPPKELLEHSGKENA